MHNSLVPEQNSIQVLSEEISSANTSAEYLSQKRAWGEDRLGVARLLSLFSPAGHSLVSWAAACGQTEAVEILMNHGATAELGDEIRVVSASIIQVVGVRVVLRSAAKGWCTHIGCLPYFTLLWFHGKGQCTASIVTCFRDFDQKECFISFSAHLPPPPPSPPSPSLAPPLPFGGVRRSTASDGISGKHHQPLQ